MWWADYIGIPYGTGPGEATCWSLVCRIYSDQLGVDLPRYGEISAKDLIAVARAMRAPQERWRPVEAPAAYDVVLMTHRAGGAGHVGVMVDAKRLIHVQRATASVVVPVGHLSVSGKILGYRRYVA